MPAIRIPTPLRPYTEGEKEVSLDGETVQEVIENLILVYPALKPHLFSDSGELRPYVNLFLGQDDIRHLDGLSTKVGTDDKLLLIPSIAGGSSQKGRRT